MGGVIGSDAEKLREEAPTREQELQGQERFRATQAGKLEKLYEATEQINQLKKEGAECREKLGQREQEAKDVTKMLKERRKMTTEGKDRIKKLAAEIEKAQASFEQFEQLCTQVSKDVAATRAKADEARSEFEQEHFRGRLIQAVNEQAGRLKGVYGRLGDLGSINKKYDIAVSTACGMLDAIVVESTEDAQAVIEFVRGQGLKGKAEKLRPAKEAKEKVKQVVEVAQAEAGFLRKRQVEATEQINQLKKEGAECREKLGQREQEAKDVTKMLKATRIGLQGRTRHRVVTLAGGLIDASGTMSGGGGKVASGGMRASVSKYSQEEVKKFVQAYEEANAQLMQLRQEREARISLADWVWMSSLPTALDEALNSTDREIPELELRERTCTMDVNALKKQSEEGVDLYEELKVPQLTGEEKAKIKQSAPEVWSRTGCDAGERLEKLIESRSDELNTIMQQHQVLIRGGEEVGEVVEEEVRDLHNQIMNIGGDELKQAKAKLEAEGNAKAAADEFKAEEKKLKKLKEEHSKLDDKAEVVLNEYNKMHLGNLRKESMTAKDAVLEKLKDQRDEVIKKASDFKSQEVDFVNELEEARKDYAQLPLDFLRLRFEFSWEVLTVILLMALMMLLDIIIHTILTTFATSMIAATDHELVLDAGDGRSISIISKELREAAGSAGKLEAVAEELTEKELGKVPRDEVEDRIATLEDFRRADGEHRARLGDYEQVHNAREDARRTLERLRQQRMKEFMEGFSVISMKLKEMYQMITLGGDAELELVGWKQITNLSGGDTGPTPLYFMDEIDAALDFRNVSIIANYIKERTKNAQFIVISLRNHMFELADLLVGIYKTLDVSKSIAINPSGFDAVSRGTESTQEPAAGGKRPLPLQGPPGNAKRRAK
ncbi:Structural maintenance of chromosomes protein 4 [Symbiodinium microadriaticum]|uniref:Structural maintenance of chromosomes protein 4 n=1 Tax=Symbiodinium microadriaticum TaxID=2951 RepID=A0A1Q9EWG8_SYMMI|nr:Structural maintenance of chromosomes protein 4 [Symbiodinium microadriaticum]